MELLPGDMEQMDQQHLTGFGIQVSFCFVLGPCWLLFGRRKTFIIRVSDAVVVFLPCSLSTSLSLSPELTWSSMEANIFGWEFLCHLFFPPKQSVGFSTFYLVMITVILPVAISFF